MMNSARTIGNGTSRTLGRSIRVFSLALFLVSLALPTGVLAVNTCNGLFAIDYVAGPNFAIPGSVIRVRLTLGTASIQGGTELTINRLRFDLDCNDNFALGVPCTDEGAVVEYEGDGTITTTCGVVWSTGHAISSAPNEVVFTPVPTVMIPANTAIPPGFCNVEFDVKVLMNSVDSTPNDIQETTGYLASQGDAMCDNGLSSSSTQSSSIPLCPNCDLGSACSMDSCNQDTGQCIHTPKQDSTPCPDTDGDLCTIPGCNGTIGSAGGAILGCDQHHNTVICPPDGNPCTNDAGCNPSTGPCEYPTTQFSTPCPDTDQDTCTTAGCDGLGTCDQRHIVCTTTTSTSTSSTTSSSSTTTTVVSSTTTTTQCVPTGPENNTGACSDMIDNDCDGLIDCQDPDCANIFPCPTARKDPTIIKFGRAGSLDLIRGHAKLNMTPPNPIPSYPVSVLLSDLSGEIYSDGLPAYKLTGDANGKIFRFTNVAARTSGGMYSVKIKKNSDGVSYTFGFTSYGDLSRATNEHMRLQFYIGDDPNAAAEGRIFITIDTPWTKTPNGWRAPKDHS